MSEETKHGLKVFAGTLLLFGIGSVIMYLLLKAS